MDSVLLCGGRVNTHAIAKISGGLSFQPKDQKELSNIFEFETMLNLACRKYKNHLDSSIEESLLIPFDTNPEFRHPDKLASTFQTSQKCLANAVMHKILSSQVSAEVTKRIIKELAYLQTNPHPDFEIFPCSDAVDFWHLMLEAPKGTPYEDGIFCLYIEFTKDYPNKAPNIRFITPIYHCNINSAGRICHKVLDNFYSPEKKIRELLDHVYGLLLEATPDDPLDSYKAALLSSNKQEYEREARNFTQTHARNKTKIDVRIEILGGNPDIKNCYHRQFTCPLTLNLFREPVITSHGYTYEKEAIEEYLETVANQDPFSFKSLTKEQLVPNYAVLEGIEEFRSKLSDL
ncbi:Ubiquitin-conjugating enzyme E2 E2-like [Oopsacas minuta]|uniref:Ubiquitin-conjugating enzyme E2 E2-like n=1 Tax=Oopsacas minuta TaxID=111878 RepID=A0AAV7K9G4_9METZ|nr:Ubiquitin-conjugating enzyme E2 E2-like [Oopsacas minuta]